MAEIVRFPTDGNVKSEVHVEIEEDMFLIDEGLELLADFRAIDDIEVRTSIRALVKAMAAASRSVASTAR